MSTPSSQKESTPPTQAAVAAQGAMRKGRVMGNRRFEMRDADIRTALKDGFSDPLDIPIDMKNPDLDYHWVRDMFVGHVDNARMSQMQKRGWEPVSAERHPELMPLEVPGRESPVGTFVNHRGLILCDRPKQWGVIERELEYKASYESMITPAVAQSMVSEDMKKAGWETKVLQNQTMHEQEMKTFKDQFDILKFVT